MGNLTAQDVAALIRAHRPRFNRSYAIQVPPRLGQSHTAEARAKMRGRKCNEETKVLMSQRAKDRCKFRRETMAKQWAAMAELARKPHSLERRQRASVKQKGKKLTEEHKQALKEAWVRRRAAGKPMGGAQHHKKNKERLAQRGSN